MQTIHSSKANQDTDSQCVYLCRTSQCSCEWCSRGLTSDKCSNNPIIVKCTVCIYTVHDCMHLVLCTLPQYVYSWFKYICHSCSFVNKWIKKKLRYQNWRIGDGFTALVKGATTPKSLMGQFPSLPCQHWFSCWRNLTCQHSHQHNDSSRVFQKAGNNTDEVCFVTYIGGNSSNHSVRPRTTHKQPPRSIFSNLTRLGQNC